MTTALVRAILYDRSGLLRPLAEVDELLNRQKQLRPTVRRALRALAHRLWSQPDHTTEFIRTNE